MTSCVCLSTGAILGMDATLGLGGASPAPAARVGSRGHARSAGTAAARRIAVVDQRVHQNAMLGDVIVDILLRPLDDRVDLDHLALGVPLDDLGAGAGAR